MQVPTTTKTVTKVIKETREIPVTDLPLVRITKDVSGHPVGAVGYYDDKRGVVWVGVRPKGSCEQWTLRHHTVGINCEYI